MHSSPPMMALVVQDIDRYPIIIKGVKIEVVVKMIVTYGHSSARCCSVVPTTSLVLDMPWVHQKVIVVRLISIKNTIGILLDSLECA